MLLENTGVGVIGFGLKKKGTKPVIAIPGVNRIEKAHWDELKKNPSIVEMIKKGRLAIVAEDLTKKQMEDHASEVPEGSYWHQDFLGMDTDKAIEVIKKCLFLPLLKDWLDGEDRPKLVRALHEQIDICGPTAVKKQ